MAGPLRPYPPTPSSGLMAIGTFFLSHKIARNGFWQIFFPDPNFWTKIVLFLENFVTTKIKYLPTNFNVICPYFDKLSQLKYFFKKGNRVFFKVKKKLFSLMAGPLAPPLLLAWPLRKELFLRLPLVIQEIISHDMQKTLKTLQNLKPSKHKRLNIKFSYDHWS